MPGTYLVVDDSPVITSLLAKMLIRAGARDAAIETASDGEIALSMFPGLNPNVVFMDVEMPGLDGADVADEMMRADPDVKIVVITGQGLSDERVQRLRCAGAFDIVEKPIRAEQVDQILALLEREETGSGQIQ